MLSSMLLLLWPLRSEDSLVLCCNSYINMPPFVQIYICLDFFISVHACYSVAEAAETTKRPNSEG